MKHAAITLLFGTSLIVGCGKDYSASSLAPTSAVTSAVSSTSGASIKSASPKAAAGQQRTGFGFNGTVSGFPTGVVFLTGGGSFNLDALVASGGGGFRCVESVHQGPLSVSINPDDPGACQAGEGVRWDTAALLTGTMFKCTGALTEVLKPAVTNDTTVVLSADFYRASNGNNESFHANIIASDGDIAPDIPGVQNLWVQGVGCGTATVNFSR